MSEQNTDAEVAPKFKVGEEVVIREDFHSVYFQGLHAKIAGPSRTAGTGETLWPLRLDVKPFEMVIVEKHLRRPTDEPPVSEPEVEEVETESADSSKQSFLSRIIPWRR